MDLQTPPVSLAYCVLSKFPKSVTANVFSCQLLCCLRSIWALDHFLVVEGHTSLQDEHKTTYFIWLWLEAHQTYVKAWLRWNLAAERDAYLKRECFGRVGERWWPAGAGVRQRSWGGASWSLNKFKYHEVVSGYIMPSMRPGSADALY